MFKRKKCIVDDCNYPRFAKGYCKVHQYLREEKKTLSSGKKRNYIKPLSNKRAEEYAKYRIVRDEFLKGKTCEFPNCNSINVECHHSKGKIGKLLYDVRYFKALCRKHHRYVEDNPEEAYKLGLSGSRLSK